ncbi:hypothetical protein AVO42_04310 [Thiomicrospira sp. XS5]|uniref:prepilin-type N-terminal cleavage/methylation domain-containing protein n=1 Tax=Thiomicrospira sp. XS5 TaxID=1775636 RepID=UPI0007487646|nr:prepilin-type N-terminal cleavage/methylation domain-containing protein [Thiomicrospira sp. XS5]KUJ74629.1 hypothetical protein AVO42_04310 [Thiomicrospira sp. XS5]
MNQLVDDRKGLNISVAGFTLMEVVLALLLIGLLAGSYLKFSNVTSYAAQAKETRLQVQAIRDSLLTFLKVNRYLPCPDIDGDGREDRSTSTDAGITYCKERSGFLPSVQLGVDTKDAWGNPFYYRVNARSENKSRINDVCETASVFGQQGPHSRPAESGFCPETQMFYCDCGDARADGACPGNCDFDQELKGADAPPYFRLDTPPVGVDNADSLKNMVVLDDSTGGELDNGIVAMVISFGRNGDQAWSSCDNQTMTNATELENCDGDAVFQLARGRTQDDFLSWLNVFDVKRAMVEVGGFESH